MIHDPHAALAEQLRRVLNPPVGGRLHELERAARELAPLVAAGHLKRREVVGHLLSAAEVVGLGDDEAQHAVTAGLRESWVRR